VWSVEHMCSNREQRNSFPLILWVFWELMWGNEMCLQGVSTRISFSWWASTRMCDEGSYYYYYCVGELVNFSGEAIFKVCGMHAKSKWWELRRREECEGIQKTQVKWTTASCVDQQKELLKFSSNKYFVFMCL